MIVTEEEAKTKLCQERFGPVQPMPQSPPPLSTDHHGMTFAHHGAGYNMGFVTMAPQTCIGSACMAWRWQEASYPWGRSPLKARKITGFSIFSTNSSVSWDLTPWLEIIFIKALPGASPPETRGPHGYCGKAGPL